MTSIDSLKEFMETMAEKGQTTGPVAKQTITALDKAAKILNDDKNQPSPQDLCNVSTVKDVFNRFLTKFSKELSPTSANVYVSRVVKAADNYCRYQADPLGFKPTFNKAEISNAATESKIRKKTVTNSDSKETSVTTDVPMRDQSASLDRFSTVFPLRKDYMLSLNLPNDLKQDEVKRMAFYLLTLCQDFNPGTNMWQQGAPAANPALTQQQSV